MIFPVTGFPVAASAQAAVPRCAFSGGRLLVRDFTDTYEIRERLALGADDFFILKAAWLSDLLHRILVRTSPGRLNLVTQRELAKFLRITEHKADQPLFSLLWLSFENPLLESLRKCYAGWKELVTGNLSALCEQGRMLLELLRRNASSLDRQIEAVLAAYSHILTDEEREALLRVLRYLDSARFLPGGAAGNPQYGYELPGAPAIDRSHDREWMRSLVLVAKIVPVWLADIRRRRGIDARRLDQVPRAELQHLKDLGINGIWLVGLWQRSPASARIKSLSGGKNYASAYSVFDYRVADEWGGEEALGKFHALCAEYGIRLGCDMVPNHTGIDSRWLREHPDWFMQAEFSPFPNYRFEGENLAHDPRMQIYLEQGYYSRSDAAVVFALDRDGRRRYVYHGNDGTGLPWNDTAQLDHTLPDVRSAIIETAIVLARYFSIIRFDAAMTLTRYHYRRLWYPAPGDTPAIASRSAYALPQHEFDKRMPREFWAELVSVFRQRSPDTLLIAEAFWMTEMYFVRNLGMHRVYNSAFMHALRDEKNAEFERTLRNFRDYDADTLMRFVNYLSTPDEESAQTHFPNSDKYFGAMLLMATLPGLPMLAPGQTEGYREKYGMDQDSPLLDEQLDSYLIDRHRRQIAPLFALRAEFADPADLHFPSAEKPDSVFCYIAGRSKRHLILYNNSPHVAKVKISAQNFMGLFPVAGELLTWRERLSETQYRAETIAVLRDGLTLELEAYGSRAFCDFTAAVKEKAAAPDRFPRFGEYLSGVAVPVAALQSERSCGIGEFLDLRLLIDWCAATGQRMINLLPVNDTGYNSSPYSALSAMALHPVYISLDALPLPESLRAEVETMRRQSKSSERVKFYEIVHFKERILRELYDRDPQAALTEVPAEFRAQQWLRDYAVFRVLKARFAGSAWFDWHQADVPVEMRALLNAPDLAARAAFFAANEKEAGFYVWVQYLLHQQLSSVRDYALAKAVYLKGDMPILLERDSVDVWLNPQLFNHQLRAGAPPDMFSPEGQNWGLPVYNWPEHERQNFSWWRERILQLDRYFSAYRIDHVLGFFRIWSIELGNRSGLDGFYLPSLALSRDEFYGLVEDEAACARISLVQIAPEELQSFPETASKSLIVIGNELFLPHELNSESAIESLGLPEDLRHRLLRRLHGRAFIHFDGKYYPAWEFEQRLAQIAEIPGHVREKLLKHVRSLQEQEQPLQHEQGRRILMALKEVSRMLPCAEDLGVVPDYVRPALADLGILSLKVYRWEAENGVPKNPATYPYLSLATSSVHDSSNLREWLASEPLQVTGLQVVNGRASALQVEQILQRLYQSPSMIVMIPLQDLLALDETLHGNPANERINIPGTVSDFNWTYRMPVTLENLLGNHDLIAKIRRLVGSRPQEYRQ